MTPSRPLHALVRQAAHDFGWRDVAIAFGLIVVFLTFGNRGGYLLIPLSEGNHHPIFDPAKTYLKTFLLTGLLGRTLPLVFAMRVAELAIADGARPWRAYLAALLATTAFTLAFTEAVVRLPIGPVNRAAQHIGRPLWTTLTFVTQAGTAVVVYALWRASQRATERIRVSEAARARDLQRLQSAELLALQARVDPQLLFDTLGRVGTLWRLDPLAAETLLTDLIALLRAMLPRLGSIGSTVEREFAVVEAWLRVARALASSTDTVANVRTAISADAAHASLAPMLALPLLRAVLEVPGNGRHAWRLEAQAAGGRLMIALDAPSAAREDVVAALARAQLGPLRERLALLHRDAARLWVGHTPPLLSLDLPLAFEAVAEEAADSATARAAT